MDGHSSLLKLFLLSYQRLFFFRLLPSSRRSETRCESDPFSANPFPRDAEFQNVPPGASNGSGGSRVAVSLSLICKEARTSFGEGGRVGGGFGFLNFGLSEAGDCFGVRKGKVKVM